MQKIDDSDVDVKFTKAEEIEGASPALMPVYLLKKLNIDNFELCII